MKLTITETRPGHRRFTVEGRRLKDSLDLDKLLQVEGTIALHYSAGFNRFTAMVTVAANRAMDEALWDTITAIVQEAIDWNPERDELIRA